ncbi:P-II family nitrogen regulator [Trinickia dabaoshanensis]|uniref:P-II family nitrogen regulator n=1 Tax=Trinickia dabaoshanensis TaxID=564714 RepID=A0A2N7VRD8_9BURK|nr:P-II family nitrogen regulator [Trinickia dabaoshanensis]PMS19707.1 P-II family nitrogen regulator [Trinickia dabaoshanensis]TAM50924.1 MAG: P-II family nitrogen regulator [Paraburkholderia sp.]
MESQYIVAIVRPDRLDALEQALHALRTHGITVSKVRGFGMHLNPYADEWTTEHVKVEVFARAADVDELVAAIMEAAHIGAPGDGIVAVMPVTRFYSIHTRAEVQP